MLDSFNDLNLVMLQGQELELDIHLQTLPYSGYLVGLQIEGSQILKDLQVLNVWSQIQKAQSDCLQVYHLVSPIL